MDAKLVAMKVPCWVGKTVVHLDLLMDTSLVVMRVLDWVAQMEKISVGQLVENLAALMALR